MGDRANVCLKQENDQGKIYLYTHWSGTKLPATVQNALQRSKDRWNDEPYLGRIIFSEMIKNDIMDLTGYGISTYVCDGEDRIITIDVDNQTVSTKSKSYTFTQFIELPANEIMNFWRH